MFMFKSSGITILLATWIQSNTMNEKKFAKFDTLMEAFFEFMKHEKGGWDIQTKDFYLKYIEYRNSKGDDETNVVTDIALFLKFMHLTDRGLKAAYDQHSHNSTGDYEGTKYQRIVLQEQTA